MWWEPQSGGLRVLGGAPGGGGGEDGGNGFRGVVDVAPLVEEEEVAVEAEKKIVVRLPVAVVRLPVAVTESVAGAVVADDVAIVEEAGKGKEVAVVAEENDSGLGSHEEDWTVVRKKVREREEIRKRREFKERDAVRKRMNVWQPAKVVVPNAPLGPRGGRVVDNSEGPSGPRSFDGRLVKVEGVERVGGAVAPMAPAGAPSGPAAYGGMVIGNERRFARGRLEVRERGFVNGRLVMGRQLPVGRRRDAVYVGRNMARGVGRGRGIPVFRGGWDGGDF